MQSDQQMVLVMMMMMITPAPIKARIQLVDAFCSIDECLVVVILTDGYQPLTNIHFVLDHANTVVSV